MESHMTLSERLNHLKDKLDKFHCKMKKECDYRKTDHQDEAKGLSDEFNKIARDILAKPQGQLKEDLKQWPTLQGEGSKLRAKDYRDHLEQVLGGLNVKVAHRTVAWVLVLRRVFDQIKNGRTDFDFGQSQLRLTKKRRLPVWSNNIDFARNELKNDGKLDASERGYWRLEPRETSTRALDKDDVEGTSQIRWPSIHELLQAKTSDNRKKAKRSFALYQIFAEIIRKIKETDEVKVDEAKVKSAVENIMKQRPAVFDDDHFFGFEKRPGKDDSDTSNAYEEKLKEWREKLENEFECNWNNILRRLILTTTVSPVLALEDDLSNTKPDEPSTETWLSSLVRFAKDAKADKETGGGLDLNCDEVTNWRHYLAAVLKKLDTTFVEDEVVRSQVVEAFMTGEEDEDVVRLKLGDLGWSDSDARRTGDELVGEKQNGDVFVDQKQNWRVQLDFAAKTLEYLGYLQSREAKGKIEWRELESVL